MASEENSKSGNPVTGIFNSLPSEAKGIISALLVFIAFFAALQAFLNMPSYFKKLASPENVQKQCWELRALNGTVFKFNRCTGEVSEVETHKESKAAIPWPKKSVSTPEANP